MLLGLLLVVAAVAATVFFLNRLDEESVREVAADAGRPADAAQVERGRYLALAGNCAGCHTARGGAAYAGGAGIDTPFGTVFASNLTPDRETGIGDWSASHFWRAMHNGRSRDGRLLYPVFPYPNYTRITREDSDAIHAWLGTLTPVARANTPHTLRFPYDSQVSLAVWRALFFRPHEHESRADKSPEWNRGAYLVNGLGHCNACHSGRNLFGATTGTLDLSGGLIPMQNWYAPSLASADEAGVAAWETQEVVDLLATGVSSRGSVLGPMADVVFRSTQHLSAPDLQAVAIFLKELPQVPGTARASPATTSAPDGQTLQRGTEVYEAQCAGCHGTDGAGRSGAYPPLAGNRAVTMDPPANVVRIVLGGGYAPSTAGNPRPYGMPPYATSLSDAEIAAVLTMIRNSWGNSATSITTVDVQRYRGGSGSGG
ncbi:MAG TPA: c-type cytochrome [Lautropia sp.]|nr:c-type cytochrome [Lautropia sp.]